MKFRKVEECRFCDSGRPIYPYGKDETCHCSGCGAEWDPVLVSEKIYVEEEDIDVDDLFEDYLHRFKEEDDEEPVVQHCLECGTEEDVMDNGYCVSCHADSIIYGCEHCGCNTKDSDGATYVSTYAIYYCCACAKKFDTCGVCHQQRPDDEMPPGGICIKCLYLSSKSWMIRLRVRGFSLMRRIQIKFKGRK